MQVYSHKHREQHTDTENNTQTQITTHRHREQHTDTENNTHREQHTHVHSDTGKDSAAADYHDHTCAHTHMRAHTRS